MYNYLWMPYLDQICILNQENITGTIKGGSSSKGVLKTIWSALVHFWRPWSSLYMKCSINLSRKRVFSPSPFCGPQINVAGPPPTPFKKFLHPLKRPVSKIYQEWCISISSLIKIKPLTCSRLLICRAWEVLPRATYQ